MRGIVLFLFSIVVSGSANADKAGQAVCAAGDQTFHSCAAKMQPLDHEIALNQFQSVVFCANRTKGSYAIAVDFAAQPQQFGMKAAGTPKVYPFKYMFWDEDLQFSMTIKGARAAANSTFSIQYTKDYSVSSSYECK